jgi:hypothetical protein
VLTADLNKDGVGDLVSINNPLALTGSAALSIFLGNADGSFKPATDVALAGNNVLSAVIEPLTSPPP